MASLLPSRRSIADWRGAGQALAALRDFDLANVSSGSTASDRSEAVPRAAKSPRACPAWGVESDVSARRSRLHGETRRRHTGSTVPRFYSSDDPPWCRVRATQREAVVPSDLLRLPGHGVTMCRDLAHKVEAVKPDRAETDRFRTEEWPRYFRSDISGAIVKAGAVMRRCSEPRLRPVAGLLRHGPTNSQRPRCLMAARSGLSTSDRMVGHTCGSPVLCQQSTRAVYVGTKFRCQPTG
jgi:hypothetical protein